MSDVLRKLMEASDVMETKACGEESSELEKPQDPEKLKAAFEAFLEKHEFEPGMIVEWKPGMRNRRSVGPFIVTELLDSPIPETEGSGPGAADYLADLDIRVAILLPSGDQLRFIEYVLDSRRLQPLSTGT